MWEHSSFPQSNCGGLNSAVFVVGWPLTHPLGAPLDSVIANDDDVTGAWEGTPSCQESLRLSFPWWNGCHCPFLLRHRRYNERPLLRPGPTRPTCELTGDPLVMALADFTDIEFEETYTTYLRQRQDWVILSAHLPKDSKKKLFLDRHGCQKTIGQGKILREHCNALPQTIHLSPCLADSTLARLYRNGTEMGLLGLYSSAHDVYATNGSLEGGRKGAGVYIVRSGKALRCRVRRSRESRTSL